MRKAAKPSAEDLKQARARAIEWRTFRRDYLYTQRYLASELACGKRTVAAIEGEEIMHPSFALLRRFRDLKKRQERLYGQPADEYNNASHLFERRA
jgi:hypothetical protein